MSFRKERHVVQQASMIGHMLKRNLIGPKTDKLHVEMGAGRGTLGRALSMAVPGVDLTMVERSSVRRKADSRLDTTHARVRIDIRDLNMAGLPSLVAEGETRPVVAAAKHLCGVATDLALRAMLTLHPGSGRWSHDRYNSRSRSSQEDVEDVSCPVAAEVCSASGDRVGGIAIATCCHHVCEWRDYVGKEFLISKGFDARDFRVMKQVSAWISLEPSVYNSCEDSCNRAMSSSSSSASCTGVEAGNGGVEVRDGERAATPNEGVAHEGRRTRCSQRHIQPSQEDVIEISGDTRKTQAFAADQTMSYDEDGDYRAALGPLAFDHLSVAEKVKAARECKRLIDKGRCAFLENSLGLRSELVTFVDRDVTPENVLLLGHRR